MRILFDIGHPAHVHFFKHAIRRLRERGHEIAISARDKDVALALLDHYGFPYRVLSGVGQGRFALHREFLRREWGLLRLIREFNPQVVTAIGGAFIAPVCKLLGKPSVVFTDTEHVAIDRYLTYPLATVICTPDCFKRDLGPRQVRYAGYHELAYLHPNYFRPDPGVLDELGLEADEPFALLRFVSWRASHDVGQRGFSLPAKLRAVESLSRHAKVFITSEALLPPELQPYRIALPPHRIHDALAFARLYMGEGATMATEAGLLGTPSVYVSSLAGTMGNLEEMMHRYRLVYACREAEEGLQRALQLLNSEEAKDEHRARRDRLLSEKIDVTRFVCETLEKYASRY